MNVYLWFEEMKSGYRHKKTTFHIKKTNSRIFKKHSLTHLKFITFPMKWGLFLYAYYDVIVEL